MSRRKEGSVIENGHGREAQENPIDSMAAIRSAIQKAWALRPGPGVPCGRSWGLGRQEVIKAIEESLGIGVVARRVVETPPGGETVRT